jgi:hypothetical protein
MAAVTDPVLARRARIARWSVLGKRFGYALYAAAVVLFFVGLAVGFDQGLGTAIIAALLIGGAALAPAIVFAYGVKAADREEREEREERGLTDPP